MCCSHGPERKSFCGAEKILVARAIVAPHRAQSMPEIAGCGSIGPIDFRRAIYLPPVAFCPIGAGNGISSQTDRGCRWRQQKPPPCRWRYQERQTDLTVERNGRRTPSGARRQELGAVSRTLCADGRANETALCVLMTCRSRMIFTSNRCAVLRLDRLEHWLSPLASADLEAGG